MKNTIFAATAAIALSTALPAAAADWYAQVNAGATVGNEADVTVTFTPEDEDIDALSMSGEGDVNEGLAIGAAGGVALGGGFRVEGEALYTTSDLGSIEELDLDNMELSNMALFANVLYDFTMGPVQPYVGAGVGFGSASFEANGDSQHNEGTVWQARLGASYPVNEALTLDFGYRYLQLADAEADVDLSIEVDGETDPVDGVLGLGFEQTSHVLTIGARFKLGGGDDAS